MTATIHLQGVGLIAAKPACEFAVGDVTCWNYGHTATITAIRPRGTTQIIWTLRSPDGFTADRYIKVDRLVALIETESPESQNAGFFEASGYPRF